MTAAGWMFMFASIALVLGLNIFCFGRLLARGERETTQDPRDPRPGAPR